MQAESDRIVIPALPRLRQRRTHAWVLSLAAHALVLGLIAFILQRAVTAPQPASVRMVFVEPAPPPPPPLGGQTGAASAPVVPEPVVEKPLEMPKPQRLVVLHKAKPKPQPLPAASAVVVPRGEAQGEAGGVAGGVVGGEAGGKVGGVVGGQGDAPIPGDQVEHPPVPTTRVLPVYPPAARARNLEGRVVLRAVVDRDGRVEQAITVVESIPMLDTAAIDALRQWHFTPGRDRDGHAVRVLVDLPIRFQLR